MQSATRQTHQWKCDVLVAGGGPAGVACAIAAAREGAQVVLCQDRPVLGGNASSEIRMHVVGANSGRPCKDLILEARESGIVEEIRLENSFRNPQRSPSVFDLILYEKCRAEKNLRLLLNTTVTKARSEEGIIREVLAERPSTEDEFVIQAQIFIDCTGDGSLGAAAGAAFMMGREDHEAFGESLAVDVADRKTLGSTLLFMAREHDRPMPFIAPSWARPFSEADLRLRRHAVSGVDTGLEYGFWWIEWGGELNSIKDNEDIRDGLLAIVMGIWDHVKNGGDHGADRWALDWFGFVPGKRESRRFIGRHILTEHDVLGSRPFPDAIAYGGWPVDLHPPEGVDAPEKPPCVQNHVPLLYDIPLSACVARDIPNLLFAGRNLSATHVAFASTRVMATCAAVGQGVGTAAAVAVARQCQPSELLENVAALNEIQQRLIGADVYLIGLKGTPENNLAAFAKISASSEKANGPAQNVISAQNRAISGERGVAPERVIPGTHRWMSDPSAGLPAWLLVEWPQPVEIRDINLVFDTGLHRHLTLTYSDKYHEMMYWGTGQPELVRDYTIEARVESQWIEVVRVANNWQRRNTHILSILPCSALRVNVSAMWGIDHARIVHIGLR